MSDALGSMLNRESMHTIFKVKYPATKSKNQLNEMRKFTAYLERVSEILESCLENPRLGVDIGDSKHEHRPAEVVVKVDALADLAARHRQQNGTAAAFARLDVVEQSQAGLVGVLRLDEQQFVPLQRGDDALVIPGRHHALQIQVRSKKAHHSVWHRLHHLHQQLPVVTDHRLIVAALELGRNCNLVVAL